MSAQADRGGWTAIRPFVAGAVVLAVAMGIGRFAYTPAIVVMRRDGGLTVAFAGILASTNLAGYLLGALLAMHPFARTHRVAAVRIGTIAVVVTTAMMALPSQPLWLVARFLTGVASGIVFVLTASLLLDRAAATSSRYGVAIVFSGVGIGIAAAGVFVPAFAALGGSHAAWLGAAAVSAIALAIALPMLPSGTARAAITARSSALRGN
ncbi:MAG: YbfB/YjiJ family MFS transporter, partial [Candidatus Eremiobacteraeota bacterium]|nr:YbfB/YjiJ family MFS transporter [Candidatus Eremiobacteraeota bacterium]